MTFCVNLWIAIFSKILQTASYKIILLGVIKATSRCFKNIDGSFLNSSPQYFEFDIPILSKNTSSNISD